MPQSNEVICADSLEWLKHNGKDVTPIRMIFADPPDNIKMTYDEYYDYQCLDAYIDWLRELIDVMSEHTDIIWLSYYHKWMPWVLHHIIDLDMTWRQIIWRFTFGQHRQTDCGNGYRPLLRLASSDVEWNTDSIRIESARQRLGDARADGRGRVPDDVWEFPRVVGNARERRRWISNQHPEALVERAVLMSTQPGDMVIDMFAGSGTVHRVCKRLGRNSISIDIDSGYVERIKNDSV